MGRTLHKLREKGLGVTYINRSKALNKLQLSLKDFRRLCILKGIYPVEPPNKRKANKRASTNKTYYYLKDIQFLAHEPLINKFRSFKIFVRKLKKAIGKRDRAASDQLRSNQPIFKLDHLVKERYPNFIDAVRDLDDPLSMCFLFSTFPNNRAVKAELIQLCRRLTIEFLHYVVEARALRKVFISIKGIYYQAEIMGQSVTWIVPHTLGYSRPSDVDFKIMVTFAEFYSTMLGFINYKLYHSINLIYPPKLAVECPTAEELLKGEDDYFEFVAALNHSLKSSIQNDATDDAQVDEFPEIGDSEAIEARKKHDEEIKNLKNLFAGCKIFLNREVPKESLLFVIRCFGGEVSFDKYLHVGATFDESDQSITHQIVDRPLGNKQYINRYYVQPQWIYDSVNARSRLPVDAYFPGAELPPHLSPFVEEAYSTHDQGVSIGQRQEELNEGESEQSDDEDDDNEKNESDEEDMEVNKNIDERTSKMSVKAGVAPARLDPAKLAQREAAEEKRLAILAMPKKDRRLYKKIMFGQKRKEKEKRKLEEKRVAYHKEQKAKKKKMKA